jgi:hypothetical protein
VQLIVGSWAQPDYSQPHVIRVARMMSLYVNGVAMKARLAHQIATLYGVGNSIVGGDTRGVGCAVLGLASAS